MSTNINIKRLIIAIVAGVVIFGGVFALRAAIMYVMYSDMAERPKPVVSVEVKPVAVENWAVTVPAVGTLRAINGVDISAEVSGQVQDIMFDSGAKIEAGEVIVQLDIQEELSRLASAQATMKLANLTADRAAALEKARAGSRATLDDAEAQRSIAEATVRQINALIAKKTIVAPFSGELGLRQVDIGEYVAPGQVMFNIQDLTKIYADFTVSQRQLSLLKVGTPLNMTVDSWPGRIFTGKVTAIAPLVDVRTGMISVEGSFDNDVDPSTGLRPLRPGMLARVEAIQPDPRRVLSLPKLAVVYALAGDAVFVLEPLAEGEKTKAEDYRAKKIKEAEEKAQPIFKQAEQAKDPEEAAELRKQAEAIVNDEKNKPFAQYQVKRREVTVGQYKKDDVEILKGLTGDEMVVTVGKMKLETGTHVWIAEPNEHEKTKSDSDSNDVGSGSESTPQAQPQSSEVDNAATQE